MSEHMELWDVYDVNRVRTGKIISRPAAWGEETYHLIVHVCIFDSNGWMLIQKRCHQKRAWPDLWDVSAGGSFVSPLPQAGEISVTDTAVRFQITDFQLLPLCKFINIIDETSFFILHCKHPPNFLRPLYNKLINKSIYYRKM